MITNYASAPRDVKNYNTSELRENFLFKQLVKEDDLEVVYSHIDRVVAMGCQPIKSVIALSQKIDTDAFGVNYFLERREMGVVNLGSNGIVSVDGIRYELDKLDVVYIGLGAKEVEFESMDETDPASFYILSTPAHKKYPNKVVKQAEANRIELGSSETVNYRILTQYIHPDLVESCQLSVGITHIQPGSAWNTMPAHTHERRMEAYFYFNIEPEEVVFHFMGEPQETRHLVVKNQELVLSPSWSIHSGCGTKHYSFVWGMAGENQTFDDMDFVAKNELR